MDLFKPIEFLGPLYNFISTPTGSMIFSAVCVLSLFVLLKADAQFFFIFAFLLLVVYILFSGQEYYNQNKSTSTPQENSASVSKEQTESKENTVNLKCTVTENGDYLCKKTK